MMQSMDGYRILVPTDFSAHAAGALGIADELASSRAGYLHVLHVHPLIEASMVDFSSVQPGEPPQEVLAALQARLTEWTAGLHTPRARVRYEVVRGNPVAEIVARSAANDLAVLGTHGRSGMGLFLLGSVTERVVRHAACSVYVVKERGQRDA